MICCEEDSCSVFSVNICCRDVYNTYVGVKNQQLEQEAFSSPMPWIGLYVAVASLICLLAMAADAFRGFRHKKLWFPCNYFTLNAASLTLLAIAVKLPLDLTNSMPSATDQLAKLSGSVFACTVMGNVLPSLGSMNEKEIFMNVAALDILVITLFVNLGIQLKTGVICSNLLVEYILVMCLMLILLVMFNSSAFAVATTRNYLDRKYAELHQVASNEELEENNGKFNVEKLGRDVKKYWIMSATGSPQFVMARSATCSATGAICFVLIVLIVATIVSKNRIYCQPVAYYYNYYGSYPVGGIPAPILGKSFLQSDYDFSTLAIFVIQTTGIVVGTVGPTSRWLNGKSFSCGVNFGNVLKIDDYWIQRLVEWKERPLSLQIRSLKWKKLLEDIKKLILNSCIIIQKVIVVASKIISLASILLSSPILSCYSCCKRIASTNHEVSEPEGDTELNLSRYVLLLQGEEGLPTTILKNISNSASQLISKAKQQQPKKLLELLGKSTGFKGLAEFDSNQVPYLCPEELPNCWTLPVVTLTSIAIALPNIDNQDVDRLLSSVREGLFYISLIEKSLNSDARDLVDRAEFVWLGVGLDRKWLNKDLQKMARKGKSCMENLRTLADIAEKGVTAFKNNMNGGVGGVPLNWSINVSAANSMYRISKSILLNLRDDNGNLQDNNGQTDDELFEKLSVMIADILTACLTNLPRVITKKCFSSAIEKREDSVQQAARLVGETEDILRFIRQHELPSLDPDQLASIDHWRASIISSTSNEEASSGSTGELRISVE